jgi:hypothetical protein
MTSMQRRESMNHVLKKGFVKEEHDLHIFAQQVNNCIQTRHEAENAEKIASMVCINKLTIIPTLKKTVNNLDVTTYPR